MRSQKWIVLLLWSVLIAIPAQAKDFSAQECIPRSVDFLPPPPAEGSVDFQRDKDLYQQSRAEKGSPRWDQAVFDADLDLDGNAGIWFLDSFGIKISKTETPASYAAVQAAIAQVSKAYRSAKKHYMRTRPFVYFKEAPGSTCSPAYEADLAQNGSYPSGHTARAWAMALLLAEISPERQEAVLKRGYEIGQSRVICGVHWQSDVDAARLVASASLVQMHNNPAFRTLLSQAQQEIGELRK